MALMAPPQAPFLEVTAPDDDMEISSDAGRVEHDNDIDLVDGDDDIDYMLEDTRSEQGQSRIDEMPDAGRDDIMYDDLDEITYAEDDMHDDVPVPDEHLTDLSQYHEDSGFGQFARPQAGEGQTVPTQATRSGSFDASIASGQQALEADALIDAVDYFESVPQDQNSNASTPKPEAEPTKSEAPVSELESQGQESLDIQEHVVDTVASPSNALVGDVSTTALSYDGFTGPFDESTNDPQLSENTNPTSHDDALENPLNDDEHTFPAPGSPLSSPKQTELQEQTSSLQGEIVSSLNPVEVEVTEPSQRISNEKSEEVPDSNEDVCSLHSTIVDYEGAHISLFPPMQDDDADTFLLNDPSLADKTLVDLFRACRQVLGESIDDDLELEIYSEDLDLTISEDSIHCMTTSFSQLVDVYVTLSQQDGVNHPEPFFISLTKKFRWSSRLSALYLAADASKGLSAVQAERYPEDYAEAEDEYKDEHSEQDESAPAQSSTESESEVVTEEMNGGQETVAITTTTTTTTDTEPADGKIYTTNDDSANVDEVATEGKDSMYEIEGNDVPARAENDQLEILEQDNIEAEPDAEFEALAKDDSLNPIGDVENGDDESSGSSTVQGENDPPQSSQYSSSDDFDDDDDSWLMDNEDTVHEGSPEHLPPTSALTDEIFPKSVSDANAEDQASTLADNGEWPENDEQAHQDGSYLDNSYTEDNNFEDPEATAQDWHQVGQEDVHHYDDGDHEEVQQLDETSEQVAESEWATFDDELDFDVGAEEQHLEKDNVPIPDFSTSSGTFRVPDDSAGEEDEDSITYDDDELDLPTQPKLDTVQARSTSQSPLGKRNRDDSENGGDDGSDQELKRLKSQ